MEVTMFKGCFLVWSKTDGKGRVNEMKLPVKGSFESALSWVKGDILPNLSNAPGVKDFKLVQYSNDKVVRDQPLP